MVKKMNENIKASNKDEIIDLTEIIQESSAEDEKIIDLNVIANDPFLETLELNQVVEQVEAKTSTDEKLGKVFEGELFFANSEDMDDELPDVTVDEQSESQIELKQMLVSSEQMEKMVERVIIKLFKEKIDNVLIEAAENIVKKEIESIRTLLSEEIDK